MSVTYFMLYLDNYDGDATLNEYTLSVFPLFKAYSIPLSSHHVAENYDQVNIWYKPPSTSRN